MLSNFVTRRATGKEELVSWEQSRSSEIAGWKNISSPRSPGSSFLPPEEDDLWSHQYKLRNNQNAWWVDQAYRKKSDYRGFYAALKAVYGPSYYTKSLLRSAKGKELLTENKSILNRWSEHFQALSSACHTVQQSAHDRETQQHSLTVHQNHKWRETRLRSCPNAIHSIL